MKNSGSYFCRTYWKCLRLRVKHVKLEWYVYLFCVYKLQRQERFFSYSGFIGQRESRQMVGSPNQILFITWTGYLTNSFFFVNVKWTDLASLLLSPLICKMEKMKLPACTAPPYFLLGIQRHSQKEVPYQSLCICFLRSLFFPLSFFKKILSPLPFTTVSLGHLPPITFLKTLTVSPTLCHSSLHAALSPSRTPLLRHINCPCSLRISSRTTHSRVPESPISFRLCTPSSLCQPQRPSQHSAHTVATALVWELQLLIYKPDMTIFIILYVFSFCKFWQSAWHVVLLNAHWVNQST